MSTRYRRYSKRELLGSLHVDYVTVLPVNRFLGEPQVPRSPAAASCWTGKCPCRDILETLRGQPGTTANNALPESRKNRLLCPVQPSGQVDRWQ